MSDIYTTVSVADFNRMSGSERWGHTPDLETSDTWQKPVAQALGLEPILFEQNPDWYGGANDWQDASKILFGYDQEVRFYTIKGRETEDVLFFLAKTGAVQDDYAGDAMTDPYVRIYAHVSKDNETGEITLERLRVPEGIVDDVQSEDVIETLRAIGRHVFESYPPQDPAAAARRYLYGQ